MIIVLVYRIIEADSLLCSPWIRFVYGLDISSISATAFISSGTLFGYLSIRFVFLVFEALRCA